MASPPWCRPLRRALTVLPAVATLLGAPAAAQPHLTVQTLLLEVAPSRVDVVRWRGAPAVLVVSTAPQGAAPNLLLLRMEGERLREAARRPLPAELRWIEPLPEAAGGERWLALIGSEWFSGRPEGERLRWSLLCRCETVFAAGNGPLPFLAQFARDLDGDGTPEVLLPHWRGLTVFRLAGEGRLLQPLWQDRWEAVEDYELRDGQMKITLQLPRFLLEDADGDGVRDLIILGEEQLLLVNHPRPAPPAGGPVFVMEPDKGVRIRELKLPAALTAALEKLPTATYPTREAVLAALGAIVGTVPMEDWAPSLEAVWPVLREDIPTLFPANVAVPALGERTAKEKFRILTAADMNRDGVLDLVHVKSSETDALLGQKHLLRWYEGRNRDGTLSFSDKPQLFFSEGPAFAKLVFPERRAGAPPALFLATTEVTLLAIIRAFTLNDVSLDVFLFPWRERRLVVPPPVNGTLVFELKGGGKKNRPMLFLADLDGDGWREYLFNLETDALTAFAGSKEGPDFDDSILHQEVPLPAKPDSVLVSDLDGDGREELVIWYPRSPPGSELRRTVQVVRLIGK